MKRLHIITVLLAIATTQLGCFKDKFIDENDIIPLDTFYAQGALRFESQTDLNEFGSRNYKTIMGDVLLERISDLSPLRSITQIYGDLYIRHCNELKSLYGLNNLVYVEGSVRISQNGIKHMVDLINLKTVTGHFGIYENHKVMEIKGLPNLSSVGDNFAIERMDSLTRIDGFPSLTEIGGGMYIANCDALNSISGFSELRLVAKSFVIQDCPKLPALPSFSKLERANLMHIENCPLFQKLDGFESLVSVPTIEIYKCDILSEINIFSKINNLNSINLLEMPKLTKLANFNDIEAIGELLSIQQCGISDVNFFNNLTQLGYNSSKPKLSLISNLNLTDFCALRNVNFEKGLSYNVEQNAYNPTFQELQSEDCK